MLDDVLEFFAIKTDFDLNLMRSNQTLFDITIHALSGLQEVLKSYQPDNIVVQGDTTTSFVGALAGFYTRTKISHIEAGLRSGDKFSPYPEEINRILTGHLTDYHFAPTDLALQNLYREGIRSNAWVVANTVIDALMDGLNIVDKEDDQFLVKHFHYIVCRRRTSIAAKKSISDLSQFGFP